jgi:hypothetical protein
MAETVNVIWGNREAEYFSREGWTVFRARGFFARRANHLREKLTENPLFIGSNLYVVISGGARSRELGIPFCDSADDAVGWVEPLAKPIISGS